LSIISSSSCFSCSSPCGKLNPSVGAVDEDRDKLAVGSDFRSKMEADAHAR
jgi:hypothetical protein